MARELKIKVVAEGIEKQEQLSYLQELDCHTGQGYLYCRPLFSEEFAAVLSKGKCEPLIYKKERRVIHENRRRTFRVNFLHLQEASLTMKELRGKNVNIGNTRVMLKNIGPDGLCFISNIKIPIEPSVVLQIAAKLNGKEIVLEGIPVWSDETVDDLYEYGIEFRISEKDKAYLTELLHEAVLCKETMQNTCQS
jgi:hypothetical protein